MKAIFYLVMLIASTITNVSHAQIGMAVAVDSKGSVIKYQVAKSYSSWDATSIAVNALKSDGYKSISRCCGGSELTSGYYVIIKTYYGSDKSKIVMALGSSSSSYSEATTNAQKTLYNYTSIFWSKNIGISEVNRGTF